MLTATLAVELFEQLKKIPFIEEIDIVEQPHDVEADLSLRIHTFPGMKKDRSLVTHTVVEWAMQELERTGEMPGIYWEWADSPLVA
jgi:hypothetical protein